MKKNQLIICISVILLVLTSTFPSTAQLATKKVLTLEAAKKLAAFAESEAMKNKWTMVIALVDDGANLVYLERMDGTQIGSIEIAQQKARTAIMFKRPTKTYQERVQSGATFILKLPNVIPVEGGLPIIIDNQYIGAIGVSGGSSDQDGIVANKALDAFLSK
jgi:glc operon protein GlcG